MTIEMLEATSSTAAFAEAHRLARLGRPAYDVDPDPFFGREIRIQPRDQIGVCPRCGGWFVMVDHGIVTKRFCSTACQAAAGRRRRARARQLSVA